MSHCVSRFAVPHTLASQCINPSHSNISQFAVPISGKNGKSRIASMAVDGRDGIDQVQQRSMKTQPPRRSVQAVAPIGLWDRFPTAKTVQQMMDTMDRLIEDPMAFNGRWSSSSPVPHENGGYGRGRTPWEIKEGQSEYKLRFDMPGMTRKDVKVWVEEKMLVFKAEKAPKKKNGEGVGKEGVEEDNGEWSASSNGRYGSRIALPENVEFEKIKAEVKDGVLYINIPKAIASSKVFDISVE
ncbi:unnamed protein product [Cuscuta europaea]|uniref:SHSP domain-containing protein n=1 Tax=Cuscuta europaea TaxID=41803 RepID=A0A9P0ZNR7_CUSEU|nr:unnamed protein product [Cuscuta europaea]